MDESFILQVHRYWKVADKKTPSYQLTNKGINFPNETGIRPLVGSLMTFFLMGEFRVHLEDEITKHLFV